jgi:DNA-binding protein YbaB
MQIHELNNKRKPTNEATGIGPLDSAINATKAVWQNKNSLWNSSALATAQQSATQANAADAAAELANPGSQALSTRKLRGSQPVTVGGSAKASVTPQQQLAQVQSNPAVQQMVKNLAAQWKTQGLAVATKINASNVAEAITINPSTKDPADLKILAAIEKREAGKSDAPVAPDVKAKTNQKLNTFSTEFQNWAEPKLRAIGVNLNTVMQDQWAAKTIQDILTKLSIESLANPESTATTGLVEQFFNVVIATNQSQQQGSQGAGQARASAPRASASTTPGAEQVDDAAILRQYGLNMSASQLDTLASAMRRADKQGLGSVRNTGNELLNALVRAAGYKVAET